MCVPRSSNWSPEPATRSLTVLETSTSPGAASDETRASIETAMPADLAVRDFAFAGVEPGPDLELEPPATNRGSRRPQAPLGQVLERGENPSSGGVELAALEPCELSSDDRVVPLEQRPPGRVAEPRRQLRRADDVREEDRRQHPLRADAPRRRRRSASSPPSSRGAPRRRPTCRRRRAQAARRVRLL